jgi:RNA polymerase sigma-70 factor, ECF subfamily
LTASSPAASGDFEGIYDRVHPALWRYVHRLTGDADAADDVVQEAFVRLLARRDLDAERARLWLFTVATNLVRDQGRRSSRRRELLTARPVRPSPLATPEEQLERGERVRQVRDALEQLAERDRQMLLMREEGFRYHEIAEAVGVAAGSVGTLIARAVKRFTEVYESAEG